MYNISKTIDENMYCFIKIMIYLLQLSGEVLCYLNVGNILGCVDFHVFFMHLFYQ